MNLLQQFRMFIFLVITLALSGCPRFAYVEIYNYSGTTIEVSSSGITKIIAPANSDRFRMTGEQFEISSELGNWVYPRNIPNGGVDGPYFDGTLRVQLNKNGDLYVLNEDQEPPIEAFGEQPTGYPISVKDNSRYFKEN
ncbi:hypothetical protein [Shewanella denitrificans]|nr:hypothetical protein [Shewanella denitrificans]